MQSSSRRLDQGSPLTKWSKYKGASKQAVWQGVGGKGAILSVHWAGTEVACGVIGIRFSHSGSSDASLSCLDIQLHGA